MTFSRKKRCKNRHGFRKRQKRSSGPKKSTFGEAWRTKKVDFMLVLILLSENHVFCSERFFFAILGGKSVILDIILAPFWHQKVIKTTSKNEVGKKRAKKPQKSAFRVGPAECAGLPGGFRRVH